MPTTQGEHQDRPGSPELGIQNMTKSAPPWPESTLVTDAKSITQFRFRILVVDDELSIRELVRQTLESAGYEVLTAADGLEGLHALSKSLPDVIMSDLHMPRMSGFEFLAVVRERFPHIATIAMSGEKIMSGSSSAVADAFWQKGSYPLKELFHEFARLLAASPIRAEGKRIQNPLIFVTRDKAGYLTIACPKCLRSSKLEATGLNGELHETPCQSCGTPVRFGINPEIGPLIERYRT